MGIIKDINELLFPERHICLFCKGKSTIIKSYICKECEEKLEAINKEVYLDSYYISKVVYSLAYNRFIREKLKEYKFNGKNYLYKPFGEIMLNTINQKNLCSEIDLIMYVPSHRRKEALRGYNQSELLARYIAKFLNITLSSKNLIKIKWTKDQSQLQRLDRIKNLKGSFQVRDKEEIKFKKILLIDDIITTGTTMEECSKVLLHNGAKEVVGLALTSSKIN
ncbi:ComF family protein [Tissierella sp. MSJ-40]|uniref:ComF family protein n=1 Tax=Tissierella simiarum TaxID=2841534 RepID=A0ABS6E1A5_9FIRM|nr:ComF family protein [Tissierella simiarum]MBU5436682.1 ComF family protein [Tissierella simiarum]